MNWSHKLPREEFVLDEHLSYLDNLRVPFTVNRYCWHLREKFKVSTYQALEIISYWISIKEAQ